MLFALMFALPAIDADGFATEAQAQVVIVQGQGVRLRTGPGLGYSVYTKVNRGARLSYVTTSGDWYCVSYGGRYLYISRDFATLSYNGGGSRNNGYSGGNSYNYVRITGDGVRLRFGPGFGYDVYTKLYRGAKVRYVSTSGDWYCVLYNGRYLYVSRDFAALTR